jgi:hypothetical protein
VERGCRAWGRLRIVWEGLRRILVANPRPVWYSEVSEKGACCRPAVPNIGVCVAAKDKSGSPGV